MNISTPLEIRSESLHPLVGGQVIEMPSTSQTFTLPTGWVFAHEQAHQPTDAPDPGPLVGEGEQEQRVTAQELSDLRAEAGRAHTSWKHGMEELETYQAMRAARDRYQAKRSQSLRLATK